VHQLVSHPSNWRKQLSLDAYLKKHNIPGIQGIDTRKLAKIVTEHGYRHLGLEKALSGKEDVENDYENRLF